MSTNQETGTPSSQPLIETLRWQFQLTWKLASAWTLPNLTTKQCLWEPAPGCWTVRQLEDGVWHPDWAEPEPTPAPPVTIGWLTWQIIWWWSGVQSAFQGKIPPAYHEVSWPGSAEAVLVQLESLAADWTELLATLTDPDLERALAYPWTEPRPLRLALAWANSELMKNIAEIGYIRHLYDAAHQELP